MPQLSPNLQRPDHLAPLAEAAERAIEEGDHQIASSVPPQHGKTELIKHALVKAMLRWPDRHHGYITYQDTRAHRVSRGIQRLAARAGLDPRGSRAHWEIKGGGSLVTAGTNGALTGEPINGLLVIDDPHRNRAEAESPTIRDRVMDFYHGDAVARTHPGASTWVNHTRYHPDDMIGQLLRESPDSWEHYNLPAINDGTDPRADRPLGSALWESARPLAWLQRRRDNGTITEYDWASLYMGQPRPRGSMLFQDVRYYEALPLGASFRTVIGVDMAYSAKTSADRCALVVLAEVPGTYLNARGELEQGMVYYVLDVRCAHGGIASWSAVMRVMAAAYPEARWIWHTSSIEKEIGTLIREQSGVPLVGETIAAGHDKFVRAQPAAGLWNAGRILLRQGAKWVPDFVTEVCSFTGVKDKRDDQVDALSSGIDLLTRGLQVGVPRVFPTSFGAGAATPTVVRGVGFQW